MAGASRERWHERPMRWAQLAFTEDDPGHFDPGFWLDFFERVHADAVCLSAGGFVAFYPTQIPLHHRAPGVDRDDAFGEMVAGCRSLGMDVIARVEPHAFREDVYSAHPEWALRRADGSPRRHWSAPDLYVNCALGGYAFDFITEVIREIVRTYGVDAVFTNRWMPHGRCHCHGCRSLFREASGRDIPASGDAEGQRAYAAWEQDRMRELVRVWDAEIRRINPNAFLLPNAVGLGNIDLKVFGEGLPMICSDSQGRRGLRAPWENGRRAKLYRSVVGERPVTGIFSVGVEEAYRWKDSVQSAAEIRTWVASGIAQGTRPWMGKFNAKPLDLRWVPVVEDIYAWHWRNERYLRNTANLARVGLVSSASGSEHEDGWYQALVESRVPFSMVYADKLDLEAYRVVVLASIGVLSDGQCETIRTFVRRGGRIVATHETSLRDERGERRADFGLADVFGCSFAGTVEERVQNSYLTLRHPHPMVRELEGTSRVIGTVKRVHVDATGASEVPLTLVPSYADLPMERVYTPVGTTDIPMALCREYGHGRVVYFPMDLDRTFWDVLAPDHLALMKGAVEWAADEPAGLAVTGPGMVDVAWWRQEASMTVHLVNLNNPMTMKGPYREVIPAGPYTVSVAVPQDAHPARVRLLEADRDAEARQDGDRLVVDVPQVAVHEVVAVDLT